MQVYFTLARSKVVEPCSTPKSEIVREISQLYFSRGVALFGTEIRCVAGGRELTLCNRSHVAQEIEVVDQMEFAEFFSIDFLASDRFSAELLLLPKQLRSPGAEG